MPQGPWPAGGRPGALAVLVGCRAGCPAV